jgi:hypothetical protein
MINKIAIQAQVFWKTIFKLVNVKKFTLEM